MQRRFSVTIEFGRAPSIKIGSRCASSINQTSRQRLRIDATNSSPLECRPIELNEDHLERIALECSLQATERGQLGALNVELDQVGLAFAERDE